MCTTPIPTARHHSHCLLAYLHNLHRAPPVPSASGSDPMSVSSITTSSGYTPSEPCPFTQPPTPLDPPISPGEPEDEDDAQATPRCHAPKSPPGLHVNAGTWSWSDFDFSTPSTVRKREQEGAPVSPKTMLPPQQPTYWLPDFLEEETRGLSAEPVSEEEDEATPTQGQLAKYQYHAGGNYFLPDAAAPMVPVEVKVARERGRGNGWPPEMLSPLPGHDGGGEADGGPCKSVFGGISQSGGSWQSELPIRG